jgi:hypothetical protein
LKLENFETQYVFVLLKECVSDCFILFYREQIK